MKAMIVLVLSSVRLWAAEPVVAAKDPEALLQSGDPKLAANKRLIYDFFRIVQRGHRYDQADRFMKVDCIHHNPNLEPGLAGLKKFFQARQPGPIPEKLAELVAIVAEGDLVTVALRREYDDPVNKGQKYTSTWFDMFRIADGKIAEHWDGGLKGATTAPPR